MIEPKPCPFCGSKKIYVHGATKFWVQCLECHTEGPYPDSNLWPTIEDAIKGWNKRSELTKINKDSLQIHGTLICKNGKSWTEIPELKEVKHE